MNNKKLWIPKLKKGALSKQLNIPESEDIPMGLLKKDKGNTNRYDHNESH